MKMELGHPVAQHPHVQLCSAGPSRSSASLMAALTDHSWARATSSSSKLAQAWPFRNQQQPRPAGIAMEPHLPRIAMAHEHTIAFKSGV